MSRIWEYLTVSCVTAVYRCFLHHFLGWKITAYFGIIIPVPYQNEICNLYVISAFSLQIQMEQSDDMEVQK